MCLLPQLFACQTAAYDLSVLTEVCLYSVDVMGASPGGGLKVIDWRFTVKPIPWSTPCHASQLLQYWYYHLTLLLDSSIVTGDSQYTNPLKCGWKVYTSTVVALHDGNPSQSYRVSPHPLYEITQCYLPVTTWLEFQHSPSQARTGSRSAYPGGIEGWIALTWF